MLGARPSSWDTDSASGHEHEHEETYSRWLHETTATFDRDRLQQALTAFPDAVLRVKGVVFVAGRAEPPAVHRVGRRVTVAGAPASSSLDRTSRLVAIGHRADFDLALLTRLVDGALAP